MNLQNRKRFIELGNELMVAWGRMGRRDREFGMDNPLGSNNSREAGTALVAPRQP